MGGDAGFVLQPDLTNLRQEDPADRLSSITACPVTRMAPFIRVSFRSLLHVSLAVYVSALRPTRIIDGHVHLTNTSLLDYLWGNATAGTCPCAPPCLCSWTIPQWHNASSSLAPTRFVFVEVDVNSSQWLDEASWVQSLASNTDGYAVGAIVAQPPPGFGTASVSRDSMAAELDKFSQIHLVHGVRPSVAWASLNETSYAALLSHTSLLAVSASCLFVHASVADVFFYAVVLCRNEGCHSTSMLLWAVLVSLW
jgi:hypothetical protein